MSLNKAHFCYIRAMISRMSLLAGGTFAGLAVLLGAFGAHGLKSKLSVEQLQTFETGVRYQFYHALALIAVGLLAEKAEGLRPAVYLFISGIICFSGSIYLLSTRELLGIDHWKTVLGPITPFGGLLLMAGWGVFCYSILRSNTI
jgi:uncharacterized membrane protein YgdD (TMEM256/DUF423 family)